MRLAWLALAAPTDVDLFLVTCKKGQRVVAACIAESIDSRAQPLVEIYDSTFRRLAGTNGPDAVTDFVENDDVGEGTADVHPDAHALSGGRC